MGQTHGVNFFCRFSFFVYWTLLPSSDDEALKAESSGNKNKREVWWEGKGIEFQL